MSEGFLTSTISFAACLAASLPNTEVVTVREMMNMMKIESNEFFMVYVDAMVNLE